MDHVTICNRCPHRADCSNVGQCLTDRAAPLLACNQFSRWMLPQQARDVEAALRAGKSLKRITNGGEFGPPICGLGKFHVHVDAYPIWGSVMRKLADDNRAAADALKGGQRSKVAQCKRGHDLSDARIYHYGGHRKRCCRHCQNIAARRGGVADPVVIEKVTAKLRLGLSVTSMTKAGGETYLIRHSTLTRHRRENPAFDKIVTESMIGANSRAQQRRHQRQQRAAKRDNANDYFKIRAMTPDYLPPHVRDDITQDMMLALLQGQITRDDLRNRVRDFVTAHNRMFPTKHAMRSLDAPAFRESAMPLVETISQGLWQ